MTRAPSTPGGSGRSHLGDDEVWGFAQAGFSIVYNGQTEISYLDSHVR